MHAGSRVGDIWIRARKSVKVSGEGAIARFAATNWPAAQVWIVATIFPMPRSCAPLRLRRLNSNSTLRFGCEIGREGWEKTRQQITRLDALLAKKAEERNRVLGLFRRGRLDDKALDHQMDEIGKEETALELQLEELRGKVTSAESIAASVSSAEALLAKLSKRLDGTVSWEIKRQLVEIAGIRMDTTESWGVKQAGITVNYRFAQPDNALPMVVTQAYAGNSRVRIPTELRTIGDHIRRKRLTLKLTQDQVGEKLGVTGASIYNWESDDSKPSVLYIPAIIEFLG